MRENGSILREISQLTKSASQRWLHRLCRTALMSFCLLGLTGASGPAGKLTDIELQLGIVQRFGEKPSDQLTLQATDGDSLTLSFLGGDMKPQTLQVKSVKIQISTQTLTSPWLQEQLVLGNYRSFETAEDSAIAWRKQGIEVEIAQPDRWQVWAKREVYQTPLLRRLLLESLKANGNQTAYLDTEVQPQQPRISWKVNGLGYNRLFLDIKASKNLIKLSLGENALSPRVYAGSMRIQPNSYTTFTVVNNVNLETYLRGVVPHELDPGAPYAAHEAQAVIARTYALRNLRRFAIDKYQLCADVNCQVYQGIKGTVATSDRAIAATRGKVLTYNNELVDALYSSTNGGVTASFTDVWNGPERAYLKAFIDSTSSKWDLSRQSLADEQNFRKFITQKDGFNETGWKPFRWRRETPIAQIGKDLQRYLKRTRSNSLNFQKIQQIRVIERSPAGRILKLVVQTDKGAIELLKDDIRSAFMAPLSTLFYLEPIYAEDKTLKAYAFVGGGFGHGVGMSQTGAYNLAKLGWSSQQILNFYYPSAQIQPLNQSITFWSDRATPTQADN